MLSPAEDKTVDVRYAGGVDCSSPGIGHLWRATSLLAVCQHPTERCTYAWLTLVNVFSTTSPAEDSNIGARLCWWG